MSDTIYQIFDKMCKRILTLSVKAVINLINGLFGTDYPTDSTITYNWTEFEDQNLKKTLADTILTINNLFSYHIEIQMTEDDEIMFRVMEYGFGHAYRNRITERGKETLVFPEPVILYLSQENIDSIPKEYPLTLDFGTQGQFTYKVPVTILQNISPEELTRRKMVILIPFYLLKLRNKLATNRSETTINELKNLIKDDIIGNIKLNAELGNISSDDERQLLGLVKKLYHYLYLHYEDMEEVTIMFDHSLELETDVWDERIEELEEQLAKKDAALTEKDSALATVLKEIEKLKKQLEISK